MKTAAGLLAFASLGLVMIGYSSSNEGTQLFLNQQLDEDELSFLSWINEHSKNYPTKEEYKFRFKAFKKHMTDIANHDEVATGIKMGLNYYSDNTEEEWKMMMGLMQPEGYQAKIDSGELDFKGPIVQSDSTNKTVNWITKGKVTAVKNQGRCGSCWAFGAVGVMESDYAIQGGPLRNMSEQQAVDCVVRSSNSSCCNGCRGGLMDPTFVWFMSRQQGIAQMEQYPYNGRDTNACRRSPNIDGPLVQVIGLTQIPAHASFLRTAIDTHPITVAIEAENNWFRGY